MSLKRISTKNCSIALRDKFYKSGLAIAIASCVALAGCNDVGKPYKEYQFSVIANKTEKEVSTKELVNFSKVMLNAEYCVVIEDDIGIDKAKQLFLQKIGLNQDWNTNIRIQYPNDKKIFQCSRTNKIVINKLPQVAMPKTLPEPDEKFERDNTENSKRLAGNKLGTSV